MWKGKKKEVLIFATDYYYVVVEKLTMNKEFAVRIYKTIIENGEKVYNELYENTEVTKRTVDHWKKALELYNSFDDNQKEVFMDIIKQTMIDTVSGIFGILDGSSTLSGGNLEFEIKINGISTENELQDTFLEVVENIRNIY